MTLDELFGPDLHMDAAERFILRCVELRNVQDCVLWPFSLNHAGYGRYTVARKTQFAHSVICAVVNGPRPRGHVTAHSCGTRSCVNPAHLRWATQYDNCIDRANHGRWGVPPDVRKAIREARGKQADIARRFGVHYATVYRIKTERPRL